MIVLKYYLFVDPIAIPSNTTVENLFFSMTQNKFTQTGNYAMTCNYISFCIRNMYHLFFV